jgi:uncharacterized protein YpmB
MKKWAKILTWIGIIWVVLILIFSAVLYFKAKQFSGRMLYAEDEAAMGAWKGIIETVNGASPFTSVLVYFLEFGIPAWVIFVIAGIFGREKTVQQ